MPEALRIAEEVRNQFATAEIEWQHTISGEVEPRIYSARYAQGEFIHVYRGTASGVRLPGPDRSGQPFAFAKSQILIESGRQWEYMDESRVVRTCADEAKYIPYDDIRLLGFKDNIGVPDRPGSYLYEHEKMLRYDVQDDDGVVVVSGIYGPNGVFKKTWRLDPRFDMQPVACVVSMHDEEFNRSETIYQQVDGRWFPESTTFTVEGKHHSRIVVTRVSFDQPWHDPELTPSDLGLIPGIEVLEAGKPVMKWDGVKPVDVDEYYRLTQSGEIDNNAIVALHRRHKEGLAPRRYADQGDSAFYGLPGKVERQPRLWEDFVRRFIAYYRLNEDQTKEAWKHHGACVADAHEHRSKHDRELREMAERITKLEESPSSSGEDETELIACRKRLDELEAYFGRVFEERLKPGLAKLPTQAQIDAARARESAAARDGEAEPSRTDVQPSRTAAQP
ncbi:MAG: hypothetical protein BroJett003_26150 [Planctomycetota bacterium]|nr:MAG: hypothetical protein BroJett003_26150 [Planctomycetota bacterium]